jgi:hypothetical protein
MNRLTKTRTVMLRSGRVDPIAGVEFAMELEHEDDPPYFVSVPESEWEDMGEPDTITVTVEAGKPQKQEPPAKKARTKR